MFINVVYIDVLVKIIFLDIEEYINMKDELDKFILVNLFN